MIASAALATCSSATCSDSVALCRVVPGVVFIALIACGWTRVPLARFTMATLVVSALYLPELASWFSSAMRSKIVPGCGHGRSCCASWSPSAFSAGRVFTFQEARAGGDAGGAAKVAAAGPHGMPALSERLRKPTFAERMPLGLLYLPLILVGSALRCATVL